MPGLPLLLLSPPRVRDRAALRAAVAGRTVLVTGASSGIGEATARLLAGAGAEVVLAARREAHLHRVADDLRAAGGRTHVRPLDLSRPGDVPAFAARLEHDFPRLDVIVSNAGKSIRRPALLSAERRDLERSLAVNFSGPAALLLALLPRLIEGGGGQVVNVSTVSAKPPAAPRWASYQGSKAGFDVWLRSAALELRGRNVRVSSVYLPLVRTPMSEAGGLYGGWPALTASEAAEVVAGAIVRPRDRIAPWWLRAQELAAVLAPGALDRLLAALEERERRREAGRRA